MKALSASVDKHRLAGLQDGVFSIALTLLVLEIKLPDLPPQASPEELWWALVSLWPKLISWLLSFWVLAKYWIGEATTLTAVVQVNRVLLRLSLCRLALVSLLPFSTVLIGTHGGTRLADAIYALNLFLMGCTQLARNRYFHARPDLVVWSDPAVIRDVDRQAWVSFLCSGGALVLAFVTPGYNMLAMLPMVLMASVQDLLASRRPSARTDGSDAR